jgi:hypothetical protein
VEALRALCQLTARAASADHESNILILSLACAIDPDRDGFLIRSGNH